MQSRYDLDTVRKHCAISYRGSTEPQTVRFHARWMRHHRTLPRLLKSVQQSLQEGLAGDATFSPLESTGEWLDAPHMRGITEDILELDAALRVQSVSEWFMRYLSALMVPDALELSIVGDLKPDDSPASLDTERHLQRDMARDAYPSRVAQLPFELEVGEAPSGTATARIDYLAPVPKDYLKGSVGIGIRMPRLGGIMTQVFWNREHTQAGVCDLMPKMKAGKTDVTLTWSDFAVQPEAFLNVFLNQLVWVHHRELPIARVSVQTS